MLTLNIGIHINQFFHFRTTSLFGFGARDLAFTNHKALKKQHTHIWMEVYHGILKNKNIQVTFREQVIRDYVMRTLIKIHFYFAPENDRGDYESVCYFLLN